VLPAPIPTLSGLPPYVFAELDRLKTDARARRAALGQGPLVDLGIGSPDRPMDPGVVGAAQRAAADLGRHGYPPFRGTPEFLAAAVAFLAERFGAALDPAREVVAVSGSKEGHRADARGLLRPRRRGPRARRVLPGLRASADAARRRRRVPARARARASSPTSTRSRPRRSGGRRCWS
jgi:hypothetical protein